MNQLNIFSTASSVLIIKPRAIGDVLLSTPVITNLKRTFPNIAIDFLCEGFASDVVMGNEDIREVIPFNKKNDPTLSLVSLIRRKKYDIVVDLFCNPRTALITYFSGAKYRIGFPFRGRKYAYNIKITPRGGEVHNVDFNLDVLRYFNIPITDSTPVFPLSDESERFAGQWFSDQNFQQRVTVGINASGGWYTKKWKSDSFSKLADRIYVGKGWNIVFFWGPGEMDEVMNIQNRMQSPSTLIPLTSLKEMGALLQRCQYLVSNDSGPMHIAASLGIPTLGIFGPTNPLLQGPYGAKNLWVRHEELDCLECNLTECPIGNVCMTELSVDIVYDAFLKLVDKNPL
ncbi:MAG: glycosyltransferase family 9 protein [Ignavibacteriales bacterium]|nr:glycosyltransferase family 9 protein [Ignavibacteriales bacterium]